MYAVYKEARFSQKNVYELVKQRLPLLTCVEKTIHGVEKRWLSDKEKVPFTVASQEGHTESLMRDKKTHHLIFLKKV